MVENNKNHCTTHENTYASALYRTKTEEIYNSFERSDHLSHQVNIRTHSIDTLEPSSKQNPMERTFEAEIDAQISRGPGRKSTNSYDPAVLDFNKNFEQKIDDYLSYENRTLSFLNGSLGQKGRSQDLVQGGHQMEYQVYQDIQDSPEIPPKLPPKPKTSKTSFQNHNVINRERFSSLANKLEKTESYDSLLDSISQDSDTLAGVVMPNRLSSKKRGTRKTNKSKRSIKEEEDHLLEMLKTDHNPHNSVKLRDRISSIASRSNSRIESPQPPLTRARSRAERKELRRSIVKLSQKEKRGSIIRKLDELQSYIDNVNFQGQSILNEANGQGSDGNGSNPIQFSPVTHRTMKTIFSGKSHAASTKLQDLVDYIVDRIKDEEDAEDRVDLRSFG